jgi:hypothetical protein
VLADRSKNSAVKGERENRDDKGHASQRNYEFDHAGSIEREFLTPGEFAKSSYARPYERASLLCPRSSERGTANLGGHGLSFVCQQVLANALEQLDRVHQLQVGKAQQLFPRSHFLKPRLNRPTFGDLSFKPASGWEGSRQYGPSSC